MFFKQKKLKNLMAHVLHDNGKIRTWQPHHAEGQFNPNPMNKKIVTDFEYPRACRFRKYQIKNRSPELPRPTFFKT
jgi:hypothetical protein